MNLVNLLTGELFWELKNNLRYQGSCHHLEYSLRRVYQYNEDDFLIQRCISSFFTAWIVNSHKHANIDKLLFNYVLTCNLKLLTIKS